MAKSRVSMGPRPSWSESNPLASPLIWIWSPKSPIDDTSHPGWSTCQLPSHLPRLSGIHLLCEICPTKHLLRKIKYYSLCSPNTLCILSLWQLSQFFHKLHFLINPVKLWLPHRTINFISFIHFYNAKNNISQKFNVYQMNDQNPWAHSFHQSHNSR